MATVSAVSAFSSSQLTNPDKYNLRAYFAENVNSASSAFAVYGSVYSCLSGYNFGVFKLNDWNPTTVSLEENAFVRTNPAYKATTFTYDASRAARWWLCLCKVIYEWH